jgi:hypothetical protein
MNDTLELPILESKVQCIICLQNFEPARGALCNSVKARHFVCNADLDMWVMNESASLRITDGVAGGVPCPECKVAFHDTILARHITADGFQLYMESKHELFKRTAEENSREQFERELDRLQREVGGHAAIAISRKLLVYQLRRSILDPRQCPSCGFGPVDPGDGCDDMLRHDGEPCWCGPGNGAVQPPAPRISNACPRCGARPVSKGSWPQWDGRLSRDALPSPADTALVGRSAGLRLVSRATLRRWDEAVRAKARLRRRYRRLC